MARESRVLLLLQATRGIGRNLLAGIARYTSHAGPWTLYRQPHTYLIHGRRWDMKSLRAWQPHGAFCAQADAARIAKLAIPTILYNVDRYDGPCPTIVTDDPRAGQLAAEHLLNQGHRQFAFCGYGAIGWSDARRDAFAACVGQAGFAADVYPARRSFDWAREEPRIRGWLADLPKPIGLLCANDDMAEGVLETCRALGFGVPEDVSLVGVDDDEYVCMLQNPPLSSVRFACEVSGYEAAALLDRLMQGKERPRGQIICAAAAGVTARQSTSVLMTEDPEVREALRFIREHAGRPLRVTDVVRATSLSHRALNARFHAACGCSILKQVTRARIDHIARLLAETTMRIHEIAAMIGYEDERHIARYFKRATGMTPQAYRRQYARL